MKVEIKHRCTGAFIFECEAESVKDAVQKAVEKNVPLRDAGLYGVNLYNADLRNADLRDAGLYGVNLYNADLRDADLCGANLRNADLRSANLCGADLCGANLYNADLRNADLCGANLCGANLCNADLRGADLCGANLYNADLRGANLRNADLRSANLCDANLCHAESNYMTVGIHAAPEGELIGWKKLVGGSIAKLRIPAKARRSCATTRKHRAEWVEVLEGTGHTLHNKLRTQYEPGATVKPDGWDENRWNECSSGIHFFLTREEAEAWER